MDSLSLVERIERLSYFRDDMHAEAMPAILADVRELERERDDAVSRACAMGHPKSPGNLRDDIELFLRDAYAAGCNEVRSGGMYTAMEYAHREAPRLRAILSRTSPR